MSNQVIENRERLFSIGKSSKERVNKTLNYLENYYTLSKLKRNDRKESMIKLGKDIEDLIKLISDDINSSKKCLSELDKKALKPKALINESFFDGVIEYERNERMPEWENRMKDLKMMKEQIEQIIKLSKAENIYQIFQQYNDILKELNIK